MKCIFYNTNVGRHYVNATTVLDKNMYEHQEQYNLSLNTTNIIHREEVKGHQPVANQTRVDTEVTYMTPVPQAIEKNSIVRIHEPLSLRESLNERAWSTLSCTFASVVN